MLKIFKGLKKYAFIRDSYFFFRNLLDEMRFSSTISLKPDGLMINIGSGGFVCRNWTNLDFISDLFYNAHKGVNFIPFDIRSDSIPFADATVFCAYCSHVIEHIEEKHIEELFKEVFRVLKPNGIFRLSFPDADFLYAVTLEDHNFWHWRKEWFDTEIKAMNGMEGTPSPVDFLVREIATPRCNFYRYAQNPIDKRNLEQKIKSLTKDEFLDYLVDGLEFRAEYPNDHISWWNYDKCKKFLIKAGFKRIFSSKYRGSVTPYMCSKEFDRTRPNMSCYIEAIK
ncbi:MAG: class I SAM-dependent methyltransferase [Synergistaceae bacterium]|nr:class I SAM-dependent methyltransferase [Synergistaceae bacterium]